MKFDYNNMQNMDINKTMKYLIFISFAFQWSIISMILNLFTMGIIRIPLFILLIIDALTMITYKEKSIKKPSYILAKLWNLIEYIQTGRLNRNYNSSGNAISNINYQFINLKNKITDLINNLKDNKQKQKKYNMERELNKFNPEIGKKVIIEYTSENKKLEKKSFKYKDRAITHIKMLESKGYKNYTKYNLNPEESLTYMIYNKNRDIIDLENNTIQLKKDDKDYKFVTDGWPKK